MRIDIALGGYILLGLLIGIVAYVIEYIGKGIQKYSIEGWKVDKSVKSRHTGFFILGTIMTSSYVFIQWSALFFAPVNIIASLEGLGLVVLVLFSYFVLKEEISKIQIVGIILILLGTVFITMFTSNTGVIQSNDFNQTAFNIIAITTIIVEGILILFSKYNNYKAAGLIIGITAGTFMALQTVTKKITTIPDLALVFTLLMFGVTTLTFLFTQFAFAKANANIVVPCFTSASITIAILIGVIALSEEIILIQIFGIGIIIIGIILLTAFKKNDIIDKKNNKTL